MHWIRKSTLVLLVIVPLLLVALGGCIDTGDPLDPGNIPPPPDAATAQLLTGDWEGLTENQDLLLDALRLEFFPAGVDLRVRVFLNGSLLATPYTQVDGDRITVEAIDNSGNSGVFQGDLDRSLLRIDGTFVSQLGGRNDTGQFFVEKE